MKLHPKKTERGWELADENGMFESLETSIVFATRKAAQESADEQNFSQRGFDELSALESQCE